MDRLFELTEQEMRRGRRERAKRYIELARRIGMRYNVPVGKWKRRFCSRCLSYYIFPVNASVRVDRGKIIIKCANCDGISRYPYKE